MYIKNNKCKVGGVIMKKFLSVVFCALICFNFTACNQEGKNVSGQKDAVELVKMIYVGKISVSLPEEWQEKMQPDQMTFIFENRKKENIGKLIIGSVAVEEPQAVNNFKSIEPLEKDKDLKDEIKVITGIISDGSLLTEYHYICEKRDYVFIFNEKANMNEVYAVLNSVKHM